jgi:hypothetical protein
VAVPAALAVALALALAGCGGGGDESADPASVAPNDAPIYLEVTLQPDGKVRAGAEDALEKVLRTQDVSRRVVELLDQGLQDQGLQYERDLKPWLGRKGAVVVTSFGSAGAGADAAVILAASDTDQALEKLEKPFRAEHADVEEREHRDVEYKIAPGDDEALGVVGDFAVLGSEAGLRAVIDAREDDQALADDERFKEATDRAPDDRLATFHLDPKALVDAIAARAGPRAGQLGNLPGLGDAEPVVGGITADGERIAFEISHDPDTAADPSLGGLPESTPLVGALPEDSWAAFGVPDLGRAIEGIVNTVGQAQGLSPSILRDLLRAQTGIDIQRDVIDWAGDIAFFARGVRADELQTGAVIEAKDPRAAERGLEKLGIALERQTGDVKVGRLPKGTDGEGFTLEIRGVDRPIEVVTRGNRVAIVYGRDAVDAALEPPGRLSDSRTFRDAAGALGGGIEPSLFVAMRPILRLADNETREDDGFRAARPFLAGIDSLSAGSKREGDRTLTRLVIKLK